MIFSPENLVIDLLWLLFVFLIFLARFSGLLGFQSVFDPAQPS
ncbi:hypothetical protein EDC14_100863 [Hydrogenispora ethanolica]|jgi:hypothetical protein|uniref:Uncharacterized protein n=1 Tax=Hydrogenispora ethanolica TaxID=1082276 RepID=A0A4R1RW66_HYDET|nr:hypothetical protein EDC14_100863 [Hydrogenispora ethanolica]